MLDGAREVRRRARGLTDLPSAAKRNRPKAVTVAEVGSAQPVEEKPAEEAEEQEEIREAELIGQEGAKNALREVLAMAKVNQERTTRGLKAPKVNLHAILTGSPGTGKTTFARFDAQEVRKLGLLEPGQLVEVSRQELVAEYAGQTAARTSSVVDKALGGIIFIDEAYALKQGDNDAFGQEAIDTLVRRMEDDRDRLIVILAGYTNEMREFLQHNTGLRSRIPNQIEFVDFDDAELAAILDIFLKGGRPDLRREPRLRHRTGRAQPPRSLVRKRARRPKPL